MKRIECDRVHKVYAQASLWIYSVTIKKMRQDIWRMKCPKDTIFIGYAWLSCFFHFRSAHFQIYYGVMATTKWRALTKIHKFVKLPSLGSSSWCHDANAWERADRALPCFHKMMPIIIMLHDVPTIERIEKKCCIIDFHPCWLWLEEIAQAHSQKRMKGAAKNANGMRKRYISDLKTFLTVSTLFILSTFANIPQNVLCFAIIDIIESLKSSIFYSFFKCSIQFFHPSRFFFRVLKPLLYV